jgi:hypothetical protein
MPLAVHGVEIGRPTGERAPTASTGDNRPVSESVPTASTGLLRGSDEPLFQRLRALLTERDVDPQTAILADFFPDDVDQEFGLVVTQDRKVIQFVVHHGRLGDLKRQAADAVIGEWNDITSRWDATPHAPPSALPLTLCRGANRRPPGMRAHAALGARCRDRRSCR